MQNQTAYGQGSVACNVQAVRLFDHDGPLLILKSMSLELLSVTGPFQLCMFNSDASLLSVHFFSFGQIALT